MNQHLSSRMLGVLKGVLALAAISVLAILKLVRPRFTIQVMSTNHQFFGHLALEPEKYLSARDSALALQEVEFTGDKHWNNIVGGSIGRSGAKELTLWNFGGLDALPNQQLLTMWKRCLHVVPSFFAGTLIRASRIAPKLNVSEYRFSSLLSVDRYLDESTSHLSFTPEEIQKAEFQMRAAGINPEIPWVCLIVRSKNVTDTDSELRSRSIDDFVAASELLAEKNLQVIRMGAASSPKLMAKHKNVIDYANSGQRSELLDLFLLAHCTFAVSTLSGPDAVCMAFRRPVLYIDIANYALCFSGTKLTTWVPAVFSHRGSGERLTLRQAFESGVGWFWKDSQYRDVSLTVHQSSPAEISTYASEMVEKYATKSTMGESPVQKDYQRVMTQAMGPLGAQWHGEIRSQMSVDFLHRNAPWFLA
jgi:putative glycosyltransferase (TIGR04372 family)